MTPIAYTDRADDPQRQTPGTVLTKDMLLAVGAKLDANDVPQTYHFIDPPKAPTLRWRAGVWSMA